MQSQLVLFTFDSEINLYIKDSKCRGGGRSTVSTRGGSTINTVESIASFVDWGGSMIDVERINSKLKLSHEKAIASCVDLGGGGNWWSLMGGSTQNCIVGISWCIMGNPFSSLRYTVFALPLWNLGFFCQKIKEDRLVYSFLMKTEHYFTCQMLLRATCRRNKLNLLNSNRKMVTVDPLNSDCWSSPHISTHEAIAFSCAS